MKLSDLTLLLAIPSVAGACSAAESYLGGSDAGREDGGSAGARTDANAGDALLDANGGAGGGMGGAAGLGGGGGGTGGADPGGGAPCAPGTSNQTRVTFAISLAPGLVPDALCINSCPGYQVEFKAPNGTTLYPATPGGGCGSRLCETCDLALCTNVEGPPCESTPFSSTYESFAWTGSYYTPGSCGACNEPGCGPAAACQRFACASDGHYTATLCLTRAETHDASTCTLSTDRVCATAEFDLPSTGPIAVVLGP